jgi:3-deoxy-D-manno-octulosonate 8-phosphate phosphatase (KDO 8-P phosphatase)
MIEPVLAKRIRLVGIDVDGTMTDGGVYLGAAQDDAAVRAIELKRFDIQDGLGVVLLRAAGLKVVILTGRVSEAARLRAAELGADEFVQDASARKLPAFETILHKYNMRWEESCFVGDDLPDLPLLRRVALPIATGNACAEVKAAAIHTTVAGGGHGAVREFTETFLKARGTWTDTVRGYLRERGDATAR